MIHIVTGTPGTGKTTFAKKFASDKGFKYVDGKNVIKKFGLVEEYDSKNNSEVIDEHRFAEVCESLIMKSNSIRESLIIDSHLSQFINPKYVNMCFVTHCDLKELEKRLIERGYSKSKIRDNLDAEIFKECELEAEEAGFKIKVIDTTSVQ